MGRRIKKGILSMLLAAVALFAFASTAIASTDISRPEQIEVEVGDTFLAYFSSSYIYAATDDDSEDVLECTTEKNGKYYESTVKCLRTGEGPVVVCNRSGNPEAIYWVTVKEPEITESITLDQFESKTLSFTIPHEYADDEKATFSKKGIVSASDVEAYKGKLTAKVKGLKAGTTVMKLRYTHSGEEYVCDLPEYINIKITVKAKSLPSKLTIGKKDCDWFFSGDTYKPSKLTEDYSENNGKAYTLSNDGKFKAGKGYTVLSGGKKIKLKKSGKVSVKYAYKGKICTVVLTTVHDWNVLKKAAPRIIKPRLYHPDSYKQTGVKRMGKCLQVKYKALNGYGNEIPCTTYVCYENGKYHSFEFDGTL